MPDGKRTSTITSKAARPPSFTPHLRRLVYSPWENY